MAERFSAAVERDTAEHSVCLKNLLLDDPTAINIQTDEVEEISRQNVQFLVSQLFALPKTSTSDGVIVTLSDNNKIQLPRMQPVPVEKPKTRWERFAEAKGIKKQKRSRLVWDDVAQDWRPRYGFMSVKKTKDKNENAIIEVKKGHDAFADPFEQLADSKSIRRAKQEHRELRNKAEAAGTPIATVKAAEEVEKARPSAKRERPIELPAGIAPLGADVNSRKRGKIGLQEAMKRAQVSTASVGRFDKEGHLERKLPVKRRQKVSADVASSVDKELTEIGKAADLLVKKASKGIVDAAAVSENVISMESAPEGSGNVARTASAAAKKKGGKGGSIKKKNAGPTPKKGKVQKGGKRRK